MGYIGKSQNPTEWYDSSKDRFQDVSTGQIITRADTTQKEQFKSVGTNIAETFIDPAVKFVHSAVNAPVDIVRGLLGKEPINTTFKNTQGQDTNTIQSEFATKTVPSVESGDVSPLAATAGVVGQTVGGAADVLGAPDFAKFGSKLVDSTIEGSIGALAKAKNVVTTTAEKLLPKTAQKVLSTAEKDVYKLSAQEQKLWFQNKARVASEEASSALQKAKQAADKDILQTKEQINTFKQNLGQVTKNTSISLKKPAQQLMKDMSKKYVELTGEAADSSPSLSKTISADNLSAEIDSKFEYNPDVATSLKKELGILEKNPKEQVDLETKLPIIKSEAPPVKMVTNQEILNKARDIMQSVSNTSKSGLKAYSPEEYQAIQKYSFLMEQLGKNGVDMTQANQLWKEWIPVRNQILKQIRPFEESGKTPFASTLQSSESTATTPKQMITKIESQKFIDELEKRLGMYAGEKIKFKNGTKEFDYILLHTDDIIGFIEE